jgi:hypothetical protein
MFFFLIRATRECMYAAMQRGGISLDKRGGGRKMKQSTKRQYHIRECMYAAM